MPEGCFGSRVAAEPASRQIASEVVERPGPGFQAASGYKPGSDGIKALQRV